MNFTHISLAIDSFMKSNGSKAKIFSSKAEFQLELAIALRNTPSLKGLEIVLECPITIISGNDTYSDIAIFDRSTNEFAVIELKYKTRGYSVPPLLFPLKDHGAIPGGRYDFICDIKRIENIRTMIGCSTMIKNYICIGGTALMLTNESTYWTKTKKSCLSKNICYSNFCIGQSDVLAGTLSWNGKCSFEVGTWRSYT